MNKPIRLLKRSDELWLNTISQSKCPKDQVSTRGQTQLANPTYQVYTGQTQSLFQSSCQHSWTDTISQSDYFQDLINTGHTQSDCSNDKVNTGHTQLHHSKDQANIGNTQSVKLFQRPSQHWSHTLRPFQRPGQHWSHAISQSDRSKEHFNTG